MSDSAGWFQESLSCKQISCHDQPVTSWAKGPEAQRPGTHLLVAEGDWRSLASNRMVGLKTRMPGTPVATNKEFQEVTHRLVLDFQGFTHGGL